MMDPLSKRNNIITDPPEGLPEPSARVAKLSDRVGDTTIIDGVEDPPAIDMLDWKLGHDDKTTAHMLTTNPPVDCAEDTMRMLV